MSRPMIRIHDSLTDEIIDREMNDEEYNQYQIDIQKSIEIKNAEQQKNIEKQLLLDRLNITEEEAALLLGGYNG